MFVKGPLWGRASNGLALRNAIYNWIQLNIGNGVALRNARFEWFWINYN